MNGQLVILYVDDEYLNLSSFEILFCDHFEVMTALNAEEGLKILDQKKVQVVLSDQKMPKMNGVEFLEKVREKFPDTLRIVHSGYIDDIEITRALSDSTAHYFLDKPLDDDKFKLIIQNHFGIIS